MFVWGVGSLRDPLALFSQTPLLRADKQKRTPPRLLEKREIRRPDPPPNSVFEARWCFCLREKTTFLRAFSLRFFFFFTKILRLFFVVTFVVIKKGVTTKTASSSKERKKMSLEFKVSLKKNKKDEKERERGSDSLVLLFGQFFLVLVLTQKRCNRIERGRRRRRRRRRRQRRRRVFRRHKMATPPPPPPTPTKSRRRNIHRSDGARGV